MYYLIAFPANVYGVLLNQETNIYISFSKYQPG